MTQNTRRPPQMPSIGQPLRWVMRAWVILFVIDLINHGNHVLTFAIGLPIIFLLIVVSTLASRYAPPHQPGAAERSARGKGPSRTRKL